MNWAQHLNDQDTFKPHFFVPRVWLMSLSLAQPWACAFPLCLVANLANGVFLYSQTGWVSHQTGEESLLFFKNKSKSIFQFTENCQPYPSCAKLLLMQTVYFQLFCFILRVFHQRTKGILLLQISFRNCNVFFTKLAKLPILKNQH